MRNDSLPVVQAMYALYYYIMANNQCFSQTFNNKPTYYLTPPYKLIVATITSAILLYNILYNCS